METNIIRNIPLKIDISKLMKKLGVKAESSYAKRLELLVQDAQKNANIKFMYKVAYIEEKGEDFVVIDGVKFFSKILSINLEKVNRVFAFVATCGEELEKWSQGYTKTLDKFWADAIKEEALKNAESNLKLHLKEKFQLENIAEMNPGSLNDWPINEQESLFKLIGDTKKSIGVTLNSSFIMVPIKSTSGVIFTSDTNYKNCQLCTRENCPDRKAPYDKELHQNKYDNL